MKKKQKLPKLKIVPQHPYNSENSRICIAQNTVYSAHRQCSLHTQIHTDSSDEFQGPQFGGALKQMLQSLCTFLREELLGNLLRSTSLFFFKHDSYSLIHDHFTKAINQKGNGSGTTARIRHANSRNGMPERDVSSLTPLNSRC